MQEDWSAVDDTIDWLIDKNRSGYKMVNSVRRLEEIKAFLRGKPQDWDCRADQNSLIIRTDGTLLPCFPMYNASHDWGKPGHPYFDRQQLKNVKMESQPHWFCTLNHNLAYCYNASRAIRWLLKQRKTGSVELPAVLTTDGAARLCQGIAALGQNVSTVSGARISQT